MSDTASTTSAPAATGKTNTTSQSQVKVPYEPTQFYFRPDTAEIICVPMEQAAALEAHALDMAKAVEDLHNANIKISEAVTHYGEAVSTKDPQKIQAAKAKYDQAQSWLAKVQKILASKTDDLQLAKLDTNGSGMVELIPVRPGGPGGQGKQFNRKIVHVKSNHPSTRGWRAFPIDRERNSRSSQRRNVPGSQSPESENIYAKDASGHRKLDTAKMIKQIKDIKPEIKLEFYKFDDHQFNGVITEWSKAWNAQCEGVFGKGKQNIDCSAQAQTMRYLAGVGAATVWDPKAGKMGLKAEAKAEFSLVEAKAAMQIYAPHRKGWELSFTSLTSGKVYPLGAIRAQLELVLAGVVGASVVAELTSEIECSKLKVGMRGVTVPGAPPPTISGAGPNVTEKTKITPLKADVGAFAGVKADLDVNGSLQWLDPENKAKKFEDFIKIAPGVSAMLGAAATAKLEITYNNGKFVMMVQASLCLGFGARGKIACETNALLIGKFICWVFYQLYCADFEFLVFITKRAFKALQDIQFLVIQSGKDVGQFMLDSYEQINEQVTNVLHIMDKSKARNDLATRILSDSSGSMLRHSTPETKGMLLYQLTRHDNPDWADPGNYQKADAFHNRKKAVLRVLQWVQTKREWRNVFEHMHPRGEKTNGSNYLTVKRFMMLGYDDMDDDLDAIEARLKSAPTRGYPVTANNTWAYEMCTQDHPQFAMAAIEPLSSMDVSHLA